MTQTQRRATYWAALYAWAHNNPGGRLPDWSLDKASEYLRSHREREELVASIKQQIQPSGDKTSGKARRL